MSHTTFIKILAAIVIILVMLAIGFGPLVVLVRLMLDTGPRPEKPPETTCRFGYVKVYIDPDRPGAKRSICIPGYEP